MYDLNDQFFQFYCCGGHCGARGVLLLWYTACLSYDWENQFFWLPLNGGQSSLQLVLHCFSSLLVGVRLRNSISPVAVKRRSVLLADGSSLLWQPACWCTTEEIDFSGCHWMKVSFSCGWFFTALAACLLMYDWGNRFLRLLLNEGQF